MRPTPDYTLCVHCVMLNDYVGVLWSLRSQYLGLISVEDSHPCQISGRPSSVVTVATVAYSSGYSFSSGVSLDLATNSMNMRLLLISCRGNDFFSLARLGILLWLLQAYVDTIVGSWEKATKFWNENKCMYGCNHHKATKQGRNDRKYWWSLILKVCPQTWHRKILAKFKFGGSTPVAYCKFISIAIATCLTQVGEQLNWQSEWGSQWRATRWSCIRGQHVYHVYSRCTCPSLSVSFLGRLEDLCYRLSFTR